MSAGDWYSAFLGAAPDLNLPPACPYGQEDETINLDHDQNASNQSDKTTGFTNRRDNYNQSSSSRDEAIEHGGAASSPLCPAEQMLQEILEAAHTNPNKADDVTNHDSIAHHDTPMQSDQQTESYPIQARDDAGPPVHKTDEMDSEPTPNLLAASTHHGDASHPGTHVDLPIAVQSSQYTSSNTSLSISGHQTKEPPAGGASKGKGADQVILEPIDYGKKCEECKVHSIWKRTATLCFDCLGNSPSQATRQEVIRRALVGIGSCSSCYKAEDNGADRHCLSCTQRQRDKNTRRKARKARGETWVPKGRMNGGTKTSKSKTSSKSASGGKGSKAS